MDVCSTFFEFDIAAAKMDDLKPINLAPSCQWQYSNGSAPSLKFWQHLMKGAKGNSLQTRISVQKWRTQGFEVKFRSQFFSHRIILNIGLHSTISVALAVLRLSQLKMPLGSVDIPNQRTPNPSVCSLFSSFHRTYTFVGLQTGSLLYIPLFPMLWHEIIA